MKKILILMMVIMVTLATSFAMAEDPNGETKLGRLYLFQKCDDSLKNVEGYDLYTGCPNPGNGPWPIILDNNRYGKMDYSLWGPKVKFSFQGKRLLPKTEYTLIYYPDDWPGDGLICLGNGKSNKAGNISINGNKDIGTSLPTPAKDTSDNPIDYNFNPISPSGAVGAKIWLVLTNDVNCGNGTSRMNVWNPTAYLFEYNLIVYERVEMDTDKDKED